MKQIRQSTREGTATRKGGRRTAARILAAAEQVLIEKGSAGFSLRGVAEHAGIRLANVQYYYPQREDLVRALFGKVSEDYTALNAECLVGAPDSAAGRMGAVIDFHLHNVCELRTRHFFTQLWAMLDRLDGDHAPLMRKLYKDDVDQLTERIKELHPGLKRETLRMRATMLASFIEGSMVVWCGEPDRAERKVLMNAAKKVAWSIVSPP